MWKTQRTASRTPQQWEISRSFTEVLSGLEYATGEASKSIYPSISSIIQLILSLHSKLRAHHSLPTSAGKIYASQVEHSLNNQLKRSEIHACSMVLDPWYKNFLINQNEMNVAKAYVRKLSNPEVESDSIAHESTYPEHRGCFWDFVQQANNNVYLNKLNLKLHWKLNGFFFLENLLKAKSNVH